MFGGLHRSYEPLNYDDIDAFTYAYHDIKSIDDMWPNILVGRGNGKSLYQARKWAERFKPTIKKVIFNSPATVVMWSDGTKTVVKCDKEDKFDPEKGLAMAIAKKFLGTSKSKGNYYEEFKKWLPEEEDTLEEITLYFDDKTFVKSIADAFKIPTDFLKDTKRED